MKYANLNYMDCVKKGRDLVENYKSTKYEICLLTLRVCDIQKGGHGPNKDIYSMKKFAEDIGMNIDTLRKWMEEHRNVVVKLPQVPKAEEYKIIREVMKEVTNKSSTNKVREVFNKYSSYSAEDWVLLNQIKTAKGIRNFAQDYDLSQFKQDDVSSLITIVEDTVRLLNLNRRKVVKVKKNTKVKVVSRQ